MADPAAGRYFAMQAVRILGMGVAVYGLLVATADVSWPDALPRWLGFVLFAIGLADALVVPRMMARAWSSEGMARRGAAADAVNRKDDGHP